MRVEDLDAHAGIPEALLLMLCALVTGVCAGVVISLLVGNSGRRIRGGPRARKSLLAAAAVITAASVGAGTYFAVAGFGDIEAAREANLAAVTGWAADYGITVTGDQAEDIVSGILDARLDQDYRVQGPEGEITVRVQENRGEHTLVRNLGYAPLKTISEGSAQPAAAKSPGALR